MWHPFERRTVFVSCPSDMAPEVEVVRDVVAELNREIPQGERWNFYYWADVDETWSATGTWQEFIPRANDPMVGVFICLMGERIGAALPAYFPLPEDIVLPPWVQFPWEEGADTNAVPLTGTLFELLDAVLDRARVGEGVQTVFCYIKADPQLFGTADLAAEKRGYGFEHCYDLLRAGQKRIRDIASQANYDKQVAQLDRFCTKFFRNDGHPYKCFGSEEAGPHGCMLALREQLLKDLPRILGVVSPAGPRRELKGLAAYQPDDQDILFGRDREIGLILETLRHLTDANSFGGDQAPVLLLHGRSAEGKSSILRAGLIGRLQSGRYRDFGQFITVLVDSVDLAAEDPLARFAAAIDRALENDFQSRLCNVLSWASSGESVGR
jgi:hypothetical protein